MKIIKLTAFLFAFLLVSTVSAQRSKVMSTTATYEKDAMAAQSITLDAGRSKVQDLWDQFWDERFDVDIDRFDREKSSASYLSEEVIVSTISDKTMDVLSKVSGSSNRSEVQLSIRFGYDMVVDNNKFPMEFKKAGMILDDFQTYFYERYFSEKITDLKDRLEDVRDEKEDAADDQSKASKKIAKYQDKIRKYEEKIIEEREEMGEERTVEASKADRLRELEKELSELERMRRRYVK